MSNRGRRKVMGSVSGGQGFLGSWSCVQGTERKASTGYRSNRDLILSKAKAEIRKKQAAKAEGGWLSDGTLKGSG